MDWETTIYVHLKYKRKLCLNGKWFYLHKVVSHALAWTPLKLELFKLYINFPRSPELTVKKDILIRQLNLCLAFTISSFRGLTRYIAFRVSHGLRFKNLQKSSLEHHTSRITKYTSHITYEFVILAKYYGWSWWCPLIFNKN